MIRFLGFALFALVLAAVATNASAGPQVPLVYTGIINGPQEPTNSTATGFAEVDIFTAANLMTVNESFSGLVGGAATAAHIHAPGLPGVAAAVAVPFPNFPAATNGTYSQSFDLTLAGTYTATFLTNNGGTAAGAEAALLADLAGGEAYVNIHDVNFPAGEIRGQLELRPATVPEPATLLLMGLGALGLVFMRRRAK